MFSYLRVSGRAFWSQSRGRSMIILALLILVSDVSIDAPSLYIPAIYSHTRSHFNPYSVSRMKAMLVLHPYVDSRQNFHGHPIRGHWTLRVRSKLLIVLQPIRHPTWPHGLMQPCSCSWGIVRLIPQLKVFKSLKINSINGLGTLGSSWMMSHLPMSSRRESATGWSHYIGLSWTDPTNQEDVWYCIWPGAIWAGPSRTLESTWMDRWGKSCSGKAAIDGCERDLWR